MTTAVTNFGNVVTTGTLTNNGSVGIGVPPNTDYKLYVSGGDTRLGRTGVGDEPVTGYILFTNGDFLSGGNIDTISSSRSIGNARLNWANGYFSNVLTSGATSNIGSSANVWNNGFFNNLNFTKLIPSAGFTWTAITVHSNVDTTNAYYYIDPFHIIHFRGSITSTATGSAFFGWPNEFQYDTVNFRKFPVYNITTSALNIFNGAHQSPNTLLTFVSAANGQQWTLDGLSFPLF
jgi:hypothetical protein